MTNRGTRRTTRRAAELAALSLVAMLALAGCSDDDPTTAASPTVSSPTSSSTVASPSPTPSVTASSASPPAPSASPSATPSGTTGPVDATCDASKVPGANTKGMSAEAAAKAKKLSTAARSCDVKTLVSLAKADGTGLQGDLPADQVFTAQTSRTIYSLAVLLTLPPAPGVEGTVQPRVFSAEFARDDAAWDEVVKSGLLTEQSVKAMRQSGKGYDGYRIGFTEDGTWTFFTTDG